MVNGSLEQNNGEEETGNGLGAKSSSCELKWNQPFPLLYQPFPKASVLLEKHLGEAFCGLSLASLEAWRLTACGSCQGTAIFVRNALDA